MGCGRAAYAGSCVPASTLWVLEASETKSLAGCFGVLSSVRPVATTVTWISSPMSSSKYHAVEDVGFVNIHQAMHFLGDALLFFKIEV